MAGFVQSLTFAQLVLLCGGFFSLVIAFYVAVGFGLEAKLGDRRRIFALSRADGQLRWEFFGNLRFIVLAALSFAALLGHVPFAEESVASALTTFAACWVGFEVYYWFMHRAMHGRALYRFHRLHHDSRVTSPLTGYSMSTVETIGWLVGLLGAPLVLSWFTPVSLIGLIAYHGLYQVAGNVVGHANVDFFPPSAAKRSYSWLSHPTLYHSLHHARFKNHYSFGSSFMDRLLRTEWSDWPELHARVVAGQPLRKLAERGSLGASAESAG